MEKTATLDQGTKIISLLRRFLRLKPINPPLLKAIGTTVIPATKRFVAQEHFVIGTTKKEKVKILHMNDDFGKWFTFRVEEGLSKTTLRYAKLTSIELDFRIMAELGYRKETTLSQIFSLMERQSRGEKGILLTNRWANIFYIKDSDGFLRTVSVFWRDDSWNIDAFPSGHCVWHGGDLVFSR